MALTYLTWWEYPESGDKRTSVREDVVAEAATPSRNFGGLLCIFIWRSSEPGYAGSVFVQENMQACES